ncbi:MAG: aminopeptidase P family protein [Eubacterium sp.]|nr:aminopeptidase P family protein [Eubacterium sp.]
MNETIINRISKLRTLMSQHGIDAYLIVSDDFHASEYVSDYFKTRAYLSGFTGSAGSLLVMNDWAGLWTDGRYFLQAAEQLKETGIELMKMGEEGVPTIGEFLKERMPHHGVLGFDGRTIRVSLHQKLSEVLESKNITFRDDFNPMDEMWTNRPAFPNEMVWVLDEQYTGKSTKEKLKELREKLDEKKADGILLATLDDIAWLFNLRGNDISYNPVFLSYAYIGQQLINLYRDEDTLTEAAKKTLEENGVEIRPYLQVYKDVKKIENETIVVDEHGINIALKNSFAKDVTLINEKNYVFLQKSIKNETEQQNERKAHILDGVAVTKLIYWLKAQQQDGTITSLRETDVCEKLENFRKQGEGYLGQSFAPIVASGKNGAVVHYEPIKGKDSNIEEDNFVLMDTGGQYYYGTTDITRTVAIGKLTQQQKIHYTGVLRGHIRLAMARFKYGSTGANLDVLARGPLWDLGLDYNHGTGHGVGYLLNVHEGPNGIRMKEADRSVGVTLEDGMITSDEPGLYLEGKYGIRIENMILCKKKEKTEFGQFMGFDTLTLVPYEREAILPELLEEGELDWLNQYHERVYRKLSPYLTEEENEWLRLRTSPMGIKYCSN